MTAHTHHRHLSHPHRIEELEELSTVRPYLPLAKAATQEQVAADPPRREADRGQSPPAADCTADASPCNEMQGREIEPSAADDGHASQCKEMQSPKINAPAAAEGHASECNEMQGRENELSARDDSHASQCKEMQGSKIDPPTVAEAHASECKEMQASENNLPAAMSELLSEQAKLVLSQRQQTAIGLLLVGQRDVDVAGKVGVHPTTIWRWKQNRHFRVCLEEARDVAFGSAIDRLRGLAPQAVDILHARLQAGDRTAALQLLRLIRVDRAA